MTTVEDEVNCKDQAGQDDRAARLRCIRHRGAAVLAGRVPGEPAAARVRDQGRQPADVPRRHAASRTTSRSSRVRSCTGCSSPATTARWRPGRRICCSRSPQHAGMKSDQHPYVSRIGAAECVHADRAEAEGRQLELRHLGDGIRGRDRAPVGSGPPGARQPEDAVDLLSPATTRRCRRPTAPREPTNRWASCRSRRPSTTRTSPRWSSSWASGKLDQYSIYGFAATLLFKQAVEDAVAKGGANAVTRANVLTAVKGITSFNAGGMIGTNDIADRKTGPCFLVMQVEEQEVGAHVSGEARDVRLQDVASDIDPTRPDGLTAWISRARSQSITGASTGIGRATAAAFASAGMKVVLAARRVDRLDGGGRGAAGRRLRRGRSADRRDRLRSAVAPGRCGVRRVRVVSTSRSSTPAAPAPIG